MFFAVQDTGLPEGVTDIWKLLHYKPWGRFLLAGHTRTDVYLVCSAGAGVKLRGRTTLEVKLRSCRQESGAECWEKVCACMLTTHVMGFCKLFFPYKEVIICQNDLTCDTLLPIATIIHESTSSALCMYTLHYI